MIPRGVRSALLAGAALAAACGPTPDFGNGEVVRPDEARQAARGVENFKAIIARHRADDAGRGAHAKGHACVKAVFAVRNDIAEELQHGVFTEPGRRYAAWVRFSNATPDFARSDDTNKDAHGMAIKLVDIAGEPLERPASGEAHQDFLMTDHPVFFVRDIDDYNDFLAADPIRSFFFPGWNPLTWRVKEFRIVKAMLKEAETPLTQRYFSGTAYKLGPHRVKYSALPCTADPARDPALAADPDRLRGNLARHLADADACYRFAVQRQRADRYMPVEDATREWDEDAAPFVTVADITIPAQPLAGDGGSSRFCEDLAFAPWHALPAHRPLGQLNRMRRVMYRASADFRHGLNDRPVPAARGAAAGTATD